MTRGGQVRNLISLPKSIVLTSGNIVEELTKALAGAIGGTSNGLEIIASRAGDTLGNVSDKLSLVSTKLFRGAGDITLDVAKQLGEIVRIIPILGRPMGYVVKGTGKGVYYVVASVGDLVGESIKTVGRIGRKAASVVVFTLVAASDLTEDTVREAGKVVKKVTELVNENKKNNKK